MLVGHYGEIPWIYHCSSLHVCMALYCAYCNLHFFGIPYFSPFHQWPRAGRASRGPNGDEAKGKARGTYNIHTDTQGFAESTKTTFPMVFTRTCCFYKDMLLLKHKSSLQMNIYKQHTSKYTKDHVPIIVCLRHMQSTPASTESCATKMPYQQGNRKIRFKPSNYGATCEYCAERTWLATASKA